MNKQIHLSTTIPEKLAGLRLDVALSQLFPDYSRACLQRWILQHAVTVNGQELRAKDKVTAGSTILITAEQTIASQAQPQAIPLNFIYQDEALLVINKPIGLVVHPGAGNADHTLLNALLHYHPALEHLPRAGIIHRLDKNTSGVLVIAKTLTAHHQLVKQLQARTIKREYVALVVGRVTAGGSINKPIGRHSSKRTHMTVREDGKIAITHYRVAERFRTHSVLQIFLETGRTHQIRVHMSYLHYPIVGDPLYGGRLHIPASASATLIAALREFKHQALHAKQLQLIHPVTKQELTFEAPIPADMQQLLQLLRQEEKTCER